MSVLTRSARRRIARSRRQFIGVAVTVLLGVALFAASYDAYANLEASYEQTYDRLAFADVTLSGGDAHTVAAEIATVDGVAAVTVRRQADIPIRVDGDHVLLGRIIEIPDSGQPDVGRLDVDAWPTDPSDTVLVERHMADHFGLVTGDTVDVRANGRWTALGVRGDAVSPEYLWPARSRQDVLTSADDFGVLFAPASTFDAVAERSVTQALVRFVPGGDANAIMSRISAVADANGVSLVEPRADQPSHAALQEDVAGFGELSLLFPALFLGAASMATFVFLSRLVRAERSEIATLRANGMSASRIRRHYMLQGVMVTGVAGAVGAMGGSLAGRVVTGMYTEAISVPDTVTAFRPGTILVGIGIAVLAGVAASAKPASAAARTPPGVALRGPSVDAVGHAGPVGRLLGSSRRLPARWRMVVRGIGRDRQRSRSTVVGVVLALTLILTTWGMLDTMELLLARQFEWIQRQDAEVVVDTSVTGVVDTVTSAPGVERVEPVVRTGVVLSSSSESYATELIGLRPDTRMHRFDVPLSPGELLVGRSLGGLLDVAVGDVVTIEANDRTGATVPIGGFVDEPLGTFAYADLDTVRTLAPPADRATLLISITGDADPVAVRSRLTAIPGVVAYTNSRALEDTADELMALFRVVVGVMFAFGAVMALTLIYNTMSANVADRSAELAALRVNGIPVRRLARLISAESLVLTVLALVPGCIVGWIVAWYFMDSFSSDLFDLGLRMRWRTPVLAAAAVLAVTAILQWPALRIVRSLDVSRVVRERSQ